VLTSVAELKLEDARLLRVLAHRLVQVDELDLAIELFDRVRRLRPEEPQSYRDLALALDRRAGAPGALTSASIDDYTRALALFGEIVTREWDARFPEVEVIALIEANRIQSILERHGSARPWPLDERLRRLLDFDVRVVLTWDTDQTDMDLWVVEPSGEKCFYSHASTTIGGQISKDFTGGYGPEEYTVRRAMGGEYQIKANFYGSRAQEVTGPTTVQATVITDYGRPTEQRRALTLRLTTARDVVDIGAVVAGSRRQDAK
jgi:Ca-activated chloride channel homolog